MVVFMCWKDAKQARKIRLKINGAREVMDRKHTQGNETDGTFYYTDGYLSNFQISLLYI